MKHLSLTVIIVGLVVIALIVLAVLIYFFRRPKKLKNTYFINRWSELQKLLADKSSWANAIISADILLDIALKKKRYGGKSMGERLVSAQRDFSDNDSVWFGHKLRNKIDSNPKLKLRKSDVKDALLGIRGALKDLGAFKK